MEAPNTKPYNLPSDAVWFVSGCSSGIGQSLAQLIAETTNRIAATARNPASLTEIPDGDNVLKLKLDVSSNASIEAALAATLKQWGRIDVVVNNAGYTLAGDTEGAGDAEARAVMDTNFWGMVDITKKALGIMRDENPKSGQQGGVILNVSSLGGWTGFPGQSFYHASKFAMEGWTESVAKELPSAWNIHLSVIEPGGVKTNYATSSLKMMEKRHPAYSDPSSPTNAVLGYMMSEQGRSTWTEPKDLAAAMYTVVSRGTRVPIRVPLGPDAWGMLFADLENIKKDLEEFKDVSVGLGDSKQLESISFLR
ncbi:short-chain dehydrogenase/reductase-like protein SDR [Dactylonectria macrodidyma]|uniref:Short-chain dehydrogenase/reductase-like protein SDR n=1 Tax=Dactylonectria macrodidyma TaxID=307937 RepID=A0A9P9E8A5_9HYPO|nr:short-chain dehydrogenase/reductase-like protein SDR [Dactylonectria macrodidyma]